MFSGGVIGFGMANFRDYDRSQGFLLPPDLRDWVADDDIAHFIIEAVERVPLGAFRVNERGTGKAQYHPRMMLALLIYCYAHGVFSSRRIERATHRDVSVRFIAADQHPDHDTIARFRARNQEAIEAAFAQVLLMAREIGVLKVGAVSIDGTHLHANASKIRSVRYDRVQVLRARLRADIAELMTKAAEADAADEEDDRLPAEITRRERLVAKLDEAAARLEADAQAEAEAARPDYEKKAAAHAAKAQAGQRRGSPPQPPEEKPAPARQTNLTDPDSRLMRKSGRHAYAQAYNAQAAVDADGSQLVLAGDVIQQPSDHGALAPMVRQICRRVGRPETVLADAGYGDGGSIAAVEEMEIEALVSPGGCASPRPYDFRPPPDAPPPKRKMRAPWRLRMREKLQTDDGKTKYRKRKHTVEPVFGIIKSVLGFTRFNLRGLQGVKSEWRLVTLAYNVKRLAKLKANAIAFA